MGACGWVHVDNYFLVVCFFLVGGDGSSQFWNVRMGAGGWEHGDRIMEMGAWRQERGDGSVGQFFSGCLLYKFFFFK